MFPRCVECTCRIWPWQQRHGVYYRRLRRTIYWHRRCWDGLR
jgi:hypothetical protein